jgi:drug/metabolite transporter (DMT)-like permease
MAVVIASLLPLAVAFLSWIFFKDTINLKGFFGLALGVIGILILMQNKLPKENETLGIILCFGALFSLALATIRLKYSSSENILMMVGLQMLVGSLTLFPISLAFETWTIDWTSSLILSFLYTTFFPGLLATVIWFKLLKEIGPVRAAAFHFLNPFFGVLIAFVLLEEALLITDIIGVLIITVGIIAVQLNKTVN